MPITEAVLSLIVLVIACAIFYAVETFHDIELEEEHHDDDFKTEDPDGTPAVPNQKD